MARFKETPALPRKRSESGSRQKIWERTAGVNTLSSPLYYLSITIFTLIGIWITFQVADLGIAWNEWGWLGITGVFIGVLVLSIIGIGINAVSTNPFGSFIGYTLVSVPYGILVGPFLAQFSERTITETLIGTCAYVTMLGVVGLLIPKNLAEHVKIVLAALVALLMGSFVVPFLGVEAQIFWYYVGIVIFSFIVIYDFNRAKNIPHTLDNSIDVALAIYLDVWNILIRALGIKGKDN